MPLKKTLELIHGTLGIWEISESEEELAKLCMLTNSEQEEFATVHHPNKRKEFLAGRLVLKTLLEKLNQSFNGLVKDDCGKPFLIGQTIHISLSHSYPYAGAIVSSTHPVGIDIEKPQEKLYRIAPKFLSEIEKTYVNDDLLKHCVYWCAKEVLYKIYGRKKLTFSKNLSVKATSDTQSLVGMIELPDFRQSYSIQYFLLDEYVVCFND